MSIATDFANLRAPFDPKVISWRVGATNADKTKGMALAYIDARDVLDRLDAVCTPAGWQCDYTPMSDGSTCCRIGIKVNDEWIWKANGGSNIAERDTADAQEMAAKGSYSDAFKRAAVQWGIGRYLYDLDSPWVAIEAKGKSYVIVQSEYARLRALLAGRPAPAATHQPEPPTPAPAPPRGAKGIVTLRAELKAHNSPEAVSKWWAANKTHVDALSESQKLDLHTETIDRKRELSKLTQGAA